MNQAYHYKMLTLCIRYKEIVYVSLYLHVEKQYQPVYDFISEVFFLDLR